MLGLRPWLRLLSFFPSRKIRAFTMDGVSASNHSFIMKMEQLVRARKIFGPLHTVLKTTKKVSFVIFIQKWCRFINTQGCCQIATMKDKVFFEWFSNTVNCCWVQMINHLSNKLEWNYLRTEWAVLPYKIQDDTRVRNVTEESGSISSAGLELVLFLVYFPVNGVSGDTSFTSIFWVLLSIPWYSLLLKPFPPSQHLSDTLSASLITLPMQH